MCIKSHPLWIDQMEASFEVVHHMYCPGKQIDGSFFQVVLSDFSSFPVACSSTLLLVNPFPLSPSTFRSGLWKAFRVYQLANYRLDDRTVLHHIITFNQQQTTYTVWQWWKFQLPSDVAAIVTSLCGKYAAILVVMLVYANSRHCQSNKNIAHKFCTVHITW